MSEHELEKLLGGFATNTLTAEEHSQLYKAALQDQQLFNALADEQALKELLADPAVRRRLLQALKQPGTSGAGGSLPWWAWFKRPAGLAFAGGLAAAIFAITFGTRIYQESLHRAAQSAATEDEKQAGPSVQTPQPTKAAQPSDAEPQLKAKAPVEPAKRERSAPTKQGEQPPAKVARERNESRKQVQVPVTASGKTAEQKAASADKKLATEATPPSSATAPAPRKAPAGAPAASDAAHKESARALFYGEASPLANAGNLAQEGERALKPLADSTPQANRLERKMDQFAGGGTASGAAVQVKPLGLRYSFVILGSDGQSQEVTAAIAAGSKDLVRITVETTQDAYLQILQNLGSAGTRLWWPPQETGKISLKLPAGKRSEIPLPPPAESGLLDLIIRLSPKPFGPLTMQEVGMLDRFSANLLIESVSSGGATGAQEQATYVVSQDPSTTAQIAIEIPISQ